MADRSHLRVRKWSLLLSSLALTPDAGFEAFRERRAADPKLPVERLRMARTLLDAVAQAIESTEAGRWSRIEQAHAILVRDATFDPSVPVEEPAPPGPSRVVKASSALAVEAVAPLPGPSLPSPSVEPVAPLPGPSLPSPSVPLPGPSLPSPSPPLPSVPSVPEASFHPSIEVVAPSTSRGPVRVTGEMPAFRGATELPFLGAGSDADPSRGKLAVFEAPGTVLPFARSAPTRPWASGGPSSAAVSMPSLTLEQFASFTVERDLYPAKLGEVRGRYGIPSAEVEASLERSFLDRFAREPESRTTYEDVRARYRGWLTSQR
ncbi:MAG: hypothetical protein FJ096_14295 [Deltaproteobacteria bacterium]|nr:hypothetical protein [Deltaproteobacteria bacterium]